MQIHVARNSVQLGVSSSEEIVAGLRSGRFLASDLAWREGMTAWTPLGDWPEFRGVGAPPPSPGAVGTDAAVGSSIPWEREKSLGSFFATIKTAVANPSGLSAGRYAFGDWLVFCYFALLISLPFQVVRLAIAGDPNVELGSFLKGLPYPQLQPFAEQMLKTPPTPLGLTVAGTLGGLAIAPLFYAFFGLLHWVGQRLFRIKVSVERTVSATLLATGMLILVMAPLQLLAFNFTAQVLLGAAVLIPACVVYFRTFGAATDVSPWVQFGVSCFVWFILSCCCCFVPMMMIVAVFAKGIPH